ncbi:MAG: C40 family peptidase [Chitinophagaceae bacterium]|nr:C40 family peptidase [Chitinophagaceae bacterium]
MEEEANVSAPKKVKGRKDHPGTLYSTDIEKCNDLQFKYAILMEEEVETITNERLISFLEDWYGTPYKYGGSTRRGIDCSAFACTMMDTVYNISLPRTSREQYGAGKRISKKELKQGDLVFFNTTGGVSHVGVYLNNNKFVHASTSSGVMISDLDDAYFKRRYVGACRLR